ncbi:MAG: transglutaminase-like domain-containing protein [Pseudomonadota bacterium]
MKNYLQPTAIIDSDHPDVVQFAAATTAQCGKDPRSVAVALYNAVRDTIRYDPYSPFFLPAHYRASETLRKKVGFCIPKSALLCALARARGIPARIGFATVRNHLATRQLIAFLGSDRFVYHGYAELLLGGRWVKTTPVFNADLCARFQVPPLDFDGEHDAVFQPFNAEAQPFMEYLADYGTFADVPVDAIVAAWTEAYGAVRVTAWIDAYNAGGSCRDFASEDVA